MVLSWDGFVWFYAQNGPLRVGFREVLCQNGPPGWVVGVFYAKMVLPG